MILARSSPSARSAKWPGGEGIAFYVDAEAGAGWLPIDVRELGANLLSFSPHRFHGPKGVGVLYRNRRARLSSLLHGGAQENGWRAGIENVPAIVGAGVAAEIARRDGRKWSAHCRGLQKRLWNGLKNARIPCLQLNGPDRAQTRSDKPEYFHRIHRRRKPGVALRHAWHCSGGRDQLCEQIPQNLPCAGRPSACLLRSRKAPIILSPGKDNTEEDIDYVIELVAEIVGKLRGMSPAWNEFEKGVRWQSQRGPR